MNITHKVGTGFTRKEIYKATTARLQFLQRHALIKHSYNIYFQKQKRGLVLAFFFVLNAELLKNTAHLFGHDEKIANGDCIGIQITNLGFFMLIKLVGCTFYIQYKSKDVFWEKPVPMLSRHQFMLYVITMFKRNIICQNVVSLNPFDLFFGENKTSFR